LVQIKGNIVKKAINTGTRSTLNQIKASKIKEITGVDRKVTSMGFKKAWNEELTPARIPSPSPRINENKNPASPLMMVSPTIEMKFFETRRSMVARMVDSGGGIISSLA
jgi:hypothetical protein